jgi:hypothetical protein
MEGGHQLVLNPSDPSAPSHLPPRDDDVSAPLVQIGVAVVRDTHGRGNVRFVVRGVIDFKTNVYGGVIDLKTHLYQ